jgi:hypothetical protein
MSPNWIHALESWWALGVPLLPSAALMQWALPLCWGVVLAWLGFWAVGQCWPTRWESAGAAVWAQRSKAILLAAWALMPGSYSVSFWLGLAFQIPSITTVLLCAGLLWAQWRQGSGVSVTLPFDAVRSSVWAGYAVGGVFLGWVLLLDTFAVLPLQLYAWGFSPAAPVLVMVMVLLPWVFARGAQPFFSAQLLLPIAVLLFVLLRLPTSNVWDAVLDPGLWIALHGVALRMALRRWRAP